MLPITINDVEKSIPTKWEEVKVKQYRALSEMILKDGQVKSFHILASLTGLEYNDIVNCDATSFNKVLPAIEFIHELFDERAANVPDDITINNIKVKIPKDLTKECAGQYWDSLAEQVANEKKPLIHIASIITAIYLQPEYSLAQDKNYKDGYNEKKREELTAIIDEMPVTVIMPIAAFFLTRFYKLQNLKVKQLSMKGIRSKPPQHSMRKEKTTSLQWACSIPSTPLRGAITALSIRLIKWCTRKRT